MSCAQRNGIDNHDLTASPITDERIAQRAYELWEARGCPPGDGGGIDSLLPERRRAWLAGHPLPSAIGWFSLVAVPTPPRLSRVLVPSHRRLARIDPLNDGQMIASDAMIPASTLLGVLDADHWALALPIARNESLAASAIAAGLVDENAFPREVMLESVLRYVGEALG